MCIRDRHLGLDWQLKKSYKQVDVVTNDLGLITDYSEKIVDFSKYPTRSPRNVGFDYHYIIPASLDIPPYVYLEDGIFTTAINDYTEGSNLERDKDGDFWRPGPMAEGFEFYEVLPKFIDKAKDYLTLAKKNVNPFFYIYHLLHLTLHGFQNQTIMEFQMQDSMGSLLLWLMIKLEICLNI